MAALDKTSPYHFVYLPIPHISYLSDTSFDFHIIYIDLPDHISLSESMLTVLHIQWKVPETMQIIHDF